MKANKKLIIKSAYLIYILLLVCLAYEGFTLYRSFQFYSWIKVKRTVTSTGIMQYDPILGFAPQPNSRGKMTYRLPPDIDVCYDANRFRVPAGTGASAMKRPLLLFLGCSWTHGDVCFAEEAYPYLVGNKMGGSALNAGYCAYGLSQLSIKAETLIPKFKPDYVLVQYSPWLVSRSMEEFGPSYFSKRPQPYFYKDTDGVIKIHPPVYVSKSFNYPVANYIDSQRGVGDFISFYFHVGAPIFFHDDIATTLFECKKICHIYPSPASDGTEIVKHVYYRINEICTMYNCKMVICFMDTPKNNTPASEVNEVAILKKIPGVIYVDALSALLRPLPQKDFQTYNEEYANRRGNPPRKIDSHPNPKAHKIIADAIIKAINEGPK